MSTYPLKRTKLSLFTLSSFLSISLSGCYTQLHHPGYSTHRADPNRSYQEYHSYQRPLATDSLASLDSLESVEGLISEDVADSLRAMGIEPESEEARVIVRNYYYYNTPWPWAWDYPHYSISLRYSNYREYYGGYWSPWSPPPRRYHYPNHRHRYYHRPLPPHHRHYPPRRGGSHGRYEDRPKQLFPSGSLNEHPRPGRSRSGKNLFGTPPAVGPSKPSPSAPNPSLSPSPGRSPRSSQNAPPPAESQRSKQSSGTVENDSEDEKKTPENPSGFPSQGRRR